MKNAIYPEIIKQMKLRKEKLKDVAEIIDLNYSQVSRKLTGYINWQYDDIKALCEHYNMDFNKLFRKEMKK